MKVSAATPNAITFTAQDSSATAAENDANAVAASYISYVTSNRSPVPSVVARMLVTASVATGMAPVESVLIDAAIGLLAGLLIGLVAAAARDRSEMRLWQRDQIARIAGGPVLASVAVAIPGGAARWALRSLRARLGRSPARGHRLGNAAAWQRLLADFQPLAGTSWQLRGVLERLAALQEGAGRSSLIVVAVSSDGNALMLGPKLAAFAARTGTSTALVVGPQQAPADAAGLLALAAAGGQAGNVQVLAANPADDSWSGQNVQLSVVVTAVDGGAPVVSDAIRSVPTVLAVTAGALTGQDLARVVTAVRRAGGRIAGVIVGNPEAGDRTTGLLTAPQKPAVTRPAPRMNGKVTEMR
jgi:hypothetical protein